MYLTFFESSKIFLINMAIIFMLAAKLTSPELLEINIFQDNGYDVIISEHEVSNKVLSRDSNYIVDVVM